MLHIQVLSERVDTLMTAASIVTFKEEVADGDFSTDRTDMLLELLGNKEVNEFQAKFRL